MLAVLLAMLGQAASSLATAAVVPGPSTVFSPDSHTPGQDDPCTSPATGISYAEVSGEALAPVPPGLLLDPAHDRVLARPAPSGCDQTVPPLRRPPRNLQAA